MLGLTFECLNISRSGPQCRHLCSLSLGPYLSKYTKFSHYYAIISIVQCEDLEFFEQENNRIMLTQCQGYDACKLKGYWRKFLVQIYIYARGECFRKKTTGKGLSHNQENKKSFCFEKKSQGQAADSLILGLGSKNKTEFDHIRQKYTFLKKLLFILHFGSLVIS